MWTPLEERVGHTSILKLKGCQAATGRLPHLGVRRAQHLKEYRDDKRMTSLRLSQRQRQSAPHFCPLLRFKSGAVLAAKGREADAKLGA